MPKISIIVPVYNLEEYVGDCITGLLTQKTNFEFDIIALDDGSTDGSFKILCGLAANHSNLQVLSNPENLGLARTMCKLLGLVHGEYIAYMDGDDLAYPAKLQTLADHLDSHPDCAIAYHDARMFDSDSDQTIQIYSRDHYNRPHIPANARVEHLIRYGCFLNASSVIYRRHDHLQEAVDQSCQILLDYPFHILNALFQRGTIDRIDAVLGGYRIHSDSFGGQTKRAPERRIQVLRDQERACENAARFGIDPDIIAAGIAHHRFATALYFLKAEQDDLFRRFIQEASHDNWFFDERHKLAFENQNNPDHIRQQLFPEFSP